MKAKSWKKLVKKQPGNEGQSESSAPNWGDLFGGGGLAALEELGGQSETIKNLLDERSELESQMAGLTGRDEDDRYNYSEIPSMRTRRLREQAWEESRQRAQQRAKERRENGEEWSGKRDSFAHSSKVTPLKPTNKKAGKKPDPQSGSVWSQKRDQVKQMTDSVNDKRFLNKLEKEKARFSGITEAEPEGKKKDHLSKVKERFEKPLSTARKITKTVKKANDTWDKIRDKKKEVLATTKAYKKRLEKVLGVEVGSLEDIAKKQDKLRDALKAKRKAEKLLEKLEERKEKLRTAEEEFEEKAKRLAQRIQDRLEGKKADKKEQEKREAKREARREERKRKRNNRF